MISGQKRVKRRASEYRLEAREGRGVHREMNLWLLRATSFLALSLLAQPALAKKKENPLDRMKPVPTDQPIPVVDFFRPRLFTNPELNPAGTHFAAIVSSKEDRTDLISFDLSSKKTESLTAGGSFDISNYEWLGDRRLVFSIVEDKLYSTGLFAVELGKFGHSYVLQRYNVMIPIGFPRSKPNEMIVWIRNSAKDRGADGGVLRIDTSRSLLAQDKDGVLFMDGDDGLRADIVTSYPDVKPGAAMAYMADRDGELAFAVTTWDGVSRIHRLEGGEWIPCKIDLQDVVVAAVGDAQGELLVYISQEKKSPRALHRFDAVKGVLGEKLFRDEKYDIVGERFYRHPRTGRVLGVQYNQNGPETVWFDPGYEKIQRAINAQFPGDVVRVIGSDREENQFFVSVFSDVRPTMYYHLNLKKKLASLVANVAPWIDPQRMRPMRMVEYTARDGSEIEGYVTLPDGVSRDKPAPLVVLPHGGPWARDNWGWDAEVQFLASRGYAVFQPNYRGSTGYSWKFSEEDMWDFRKMHDDVTDGVKTLLKTGLIDQDRVAIMGGSFGGYLALCGAVYEKELYRCAITIAGVFDWERVMQEARGSEYVRANFGVLRRRLGNPLKNQEKFDRISPARHVDEIKIPVFVAHGSEDMVASVAQSKRLIAELKKFGVPHEKQIERGEAHGFRKLDNQVELYTAIEAFLAKNLVPRGKTASQAGTDSTTALVVP